jgi:hypothetical protein
MNIAIKYNTITIRDTNLPPDIDKISEEFARYQITLLIDFYSGYNQIALYPNSRDITIFIISRDLIRYTILVQDITNSVVQFVRVGKAILKDYIPKYYRIFVDNISILGPRTRYSDKEVSLDIQRFV